MVISRVRYGVLLALPMLAVVTTAHVGRAEGPAAEASEAVASKTLRLPICGTNEALAARPDGSYACKPLPTVPVPLAPDCSLGGGPDDTTATCIPRGTGQTEVWYSLRKDALSKWLDSGTTARFPPAYPPRPARSFECTSFTKVSPDVYRCETTASNAGMPALPIPKCGAGQTITFTAQREVKCLDLPAGRVALPCMDFGSTQTSNDGSTIECAPRNHGAVDEPVLSRTLDVLYRMVENQAPRELGRFVKPTLRTGRIPMCSDAQSLVWRDGALLCATRGAAAITRTDASVLKLLIERVIVKLQRIQPVSDPFLPGVKLGDTPAVLFLDAKP